MAKKISCPKCKELTKKGGYKGWQIIVAITFFPVGLSELKAKRQPSICQNCGHTWQADNLSTSPA